MTHYRNEQSFLEGWNGSDFDLNRLSLGEQKNFAEVLGMVYELSSSIPNGKDYLILYPWSYSQVEFLEKRLKKPHDFNSFERKSEGTGRFNVKILNPAFEEFLKNPFRQIGPTAEYAVLDSFITHAVYRTFSRDKEKKHRKIVSITKNKNVSDWVRSFLDVRMKEVPWIELDYYEKEKPCYSTWFYDKKSLEPHMIYEDFPELKETMEELPNFNTPEKIYLVLAERDNFRRLKTYQYLKQKGIIKITRYKEKELEFERTKKLLRTIAGKTLALEQNLSTLGIFGDIVRVENEKTELDILIEERKNLEKLKNELQFELYGKENKSKGSGSDFYRRKCYKDGKHREKALLLS